MWGRRRVVTACRDDLNKGVFSFMKWRVGRWYRRSAWPACGATPDTVKRGLVNVTAGPADDAGSGERVASVFPGLDFYRPEQMHCEAVRSDPVHL